MPTDLSSPARPGTPVGDAIRSLQPRWGWFMALGVLTALLGVAALILVVSSTIASVLMIGIFMIVAGGMEIGVGINARSWGWKAVWILVGLLYVASGAFAIAQPLIAAAVFTLFLGASLLATGIVRMVAGFGIHQGPRGPVILAGLVTTLLGLMILLGWPKTLFVLGAFLGLDLLLYGAVWIVFAARLRNL